MSVLDTLDGIFLRSNPSYGGERLTTTEHMLQAAALAEREGAPEALVAAALLHDIGHFLHDFDKDCAKRGIDSKHEDVGATILADHFGDDVVEPVRLHVAAKRYLCGTEAGYFATLSPASVRSLALQGGPMPGEEAAAFIAAPHAREAVRLRRWDEDAKVPGLAVPAYAHYRPLLERLLKA